MLREAALEALYCPVLLPRVPERKNEVFLPLCKGPRVDFASSGIASIRSASSRSAPRGLEQQRLDQEPACTGDDRPSRLVAVSWRCVRLVAVSGRGASCGP